MLPEPSTGFLLVAQAENPFEKHPTIDLSELHGRSLSEWHLVLAGETCRGKTGDLVYARKGAADPVIVDGGKVLGVLHEGQISLTLKQFNGAKTVETLGEEVLKNLKSQDQAAEQPRLAIPKPKNNRILMG